MVDEDNVFLFLLSQTERKHFLFPTVSSGLWVFAFSQYNSTNQGERTKLSHFSCFIPAGTWKSLQWQQHFVLACTLSFPNPHQLPQFLFPDVTHVFPEFPAPDLGNVLLQEGFTLNDVKTLQILYRRHCEVTVWNIIWWLFVIDLLTDVGHHSCEQLISHS